MMVALSMSKELTNIKPVIVTAHCASTKQVHALIVEQLRNGKFNVIEDITLQDGEKLERVVFDDRVISIQEVDKLNITEINLQSDTSIEQEIQTKGLTAPRITSLDIEAAIASEQYFVFPSTTLTVCCLTLQNGFQVTGESACASPSNFDEEIGRKIARDNAKQKIWSLEGYRLKSELAKLPL
jgi:hypothetical protein